MTAATLFDGHRDWLAHTLAMAGQEDLPARECRLTDGTRLLMPACGILELQPPAGRPTPNGEALLVSAGIHGNETAPIEMINQLVSELLEGRWSPACPALLMLGNPAAMVAGCRFTETNLNRLFNGTHNRPEYHQLPEARRARQLEQHTRDFVQRHPGALSHYDLHTAIRPSLREKFALYPFVEGRQVPPSQCGFLLEAGVPTLLLQHRAGTTFSAFSATLAGVESFTLELGKVQPFGHNDPGRLEGIRKALLRRLQGQPAPVTGQGCTALTVFRVVHEIIHSGDGFRFHIGDDVANFTQYPPGTLIWEDNHSAYRVGSTPEAIVFPNPQVPAGQRVGLMVSAESRR